MRPSPGRGRARPLAALAAFAVLVAPLGQAAPQPSDVPGDFRNGQDNAFGAVVMVPYLRASGDEPVPVEARFWLRDLDAVRRANDFLFAFNLKGDAASVTLDSLATAEGTALVPTQTATVDGGRQPQAHFAPADLLAAAGEGPQPLELVLRGHVRPEANGQVHVGAMVIAFDAGWATLSTSAGPAQLYGFTLVMASGVPGGAMPFQGQGNTAWVLPIAVLAVVVALAGGSAASTLYRMPTAMPLPPPVRPAAPSPSVHPKAAVARTAIPVFGGPGPAPAAHVRAGSRRPGEAPNQGPWPGSPVPRQQASGVAHGPVAARQGPPVPPATKAGPVVPVVPAGPVVPVATVPAPAPPAVPGRPSSTPRAPASRTRRSPASKPRAKTQAARSGAARPGRPRQG